jgi:hypothetical protein
VGRQEGRLKREADAWRSRGRRWPKLLASSFRYRHVRPPKSLKMSQFNLLKKRAESLGYTMHLKARINMWWWDARRLLAAFCDETGEGDGPMNRSTQGNCGAPSAIDRP